MDRLEEKTSPTERDENVKYIVDLQNFNVGRALTDVEWNLAIEKI